MRFAILLGLLAAGCQQPATSPAPPPTDTIWAVDLVTTLPGQQENYIRSIETNWANARRIAQTRGSVYSYRALVAPQDSARGWDVMLMTEYTDSTAWANCEPIFQSIFESEAFVFIEPASPSVEMRSFFVGDVALRHFVLE